LVSVESGDPSRGWETLRLTCYLVQVPHQRSRSTMRITCPKIQGAPVTNSAKPTLSFATGHALSDHSPATGRARPRRKRAVPARRPKLHRFEPFATCRLVPFPVLATNSAMPFQSTATDPVTPDATIRFKPRPTYSERQPCPINPNPPPCDKLSRSPSFLTFATHLPGSRQTSATCPARPLLSDPVRLTHPTLSVSTHERLVTPALIAPKRQSHPKRQAWSPRPFPVRRVNPIRAAATYLAPSRRSTSDDPTQPSPLRTDPLRQTQPSREPSAATFQIDSRPNVPARLAFSCHASPKRLILSATTCITPAPCDTPNPSAPPATIRPAANRSIETSRAVPRRSPSDDPVLTQPERRAISSWAMPLRLAMPHRLPPPQSDKPNRITATSPLLPSCFDSFRSDTPNPLGPDPSDRSYRPEPFPGDKPSCPRRRAGPSLAMPLSPQATIQHPPHLLCLATARFRPSLTLSGATLPATPLRAYATSLIAPRRTRATRQPSSNPALPRATNLPIPTRAQATVPSNPGQFRPSRSDDPIRTQATIRSMPTRGDTPDQAFSVRAQATSPLRPAHPLPKRRVKPVRFHPEATTHTSPKRQPESDLPGPNPSD
jgi:hypothetical protein